MLLNDDGSIHAMKKFDDGREDKASYLFTIEGERLVQKQISSDITFKHVYIGDITEAPILRAKPQIGMTEAQVKASTWGYPDKKNTTTTANVTSEQWVYNSRGYIYLDNGIVTAIQER